MTALSTNFSTLQPKTVKECWVWSHRYTTWNDQERDLKQSQFCYSCIDYVRLVRNWKIFVQVQSGRTSPVLMEVSEGSKRERFPLSNWYPEIGPIVASKENRLRTGSPRHKRVSLCVRVVEDVWASRTESLWKTGRMKLCTRAEHRSIERRKTTHTTRNTTVK